jgi:hypothetical protein
MIRWEGNVTRIRGDYISVRKPDRKRPLKRPRYRYEDNVEMGLMEMRCKGVEWIQLVIQVGSAGGIL